MKKLLLTHVFFFLMIAVLSAKPYSEDIKIFRKDDPEKKHKTNTQLSSEDIEDVENSLNLLSLFFPNEIFIDSALSVNLRFQEEESEEEIERPEVSFYDFNHTIDDTIFIADTDSKEIENRMDSLNNVWQVKKYLKQRGIDSLYVNTNVKDIPDSIYVDRLNRIPALINLSYNNVVRSFIELYTQRRKEQVSVMLGLSNYYFPIFEQVLDQYNLPLELRYLPVIESALNPKARSRAGATGLWQFMHFTGKMYGLEINSYVDERSDPVKSTYAAVRYLKDLYDIYKDWTLAVAAYNCGPGNVNKAIRRSGGKRDYWGIYYYLPRETRGYVPALIAATYAMHYNKNNVIALNKEELELKNDTIMINEQLHFNQVASVLDIPIEKLREMNPQYKHDIIPGTGKSYSLKLPSEKVLNFIDQKDSIFAYKHDEFFTKKAIADIASRKAYKRYRKHKIPSTKNKTKVYYTVNNGDNLGFISSWYNVSKNNLKYWNKIYRNRIYAGKRLVIYVPSNKADFYKKINRMSFEEKQKLVGKSVPTDKTYVAKRLTNSSNNKQFVHYKVRRGDNLWTIARKFPGVSNHDIINLNKLTHYQVQHLKPGDVLKIKKM